MSANIYRGGIIGADPGGNASGVWGVGDNGLTYAPFFDPVPSVVRSAALWLDAGDLTTITESGGSVSQWDNKGTLGNFTQASAGLQPTTGVSTLNGRNVLDFAADYLTAVNTNEWKFLHDGTKYLVAAVWQAGTTADPNASYGLLGSNVVSTGVGALLTYEDTGGADDVILHLITRGVGGTFVVGNTSSNGAHAANTPRLVTVLADPSNGTAANRSELFVNAGSAIKNNTQTSAVSTANPTNALQIGASGNDSNPLTGKIAELVIVSGGDATEGNRVTIRNYLNAKWGVY